MTNVIVMAGMRIIKDLEKEDSMMKKEKSMYKGLPISFHFSEKTP